MPLNRPALSLGTGPRGVQAARRWVVETCTDIGRTELVECAELGVSELVTNALLHGEPPIHVRVRGTREHPRVEVRDGSTERPALPVTPPDDDDELLLTFGRGLSIVARSSDAWGAVIEDDGKIVWFNPAAEFAEGDGIDGVITGLDDDTVTRPVRHEDLVEVEIRGVPLRTYLGFQRHYRELRREVRLLALAHEDDYPLAKSLSDLFGSLERHLREGIRMPEIERYTPFIAIKIKEETSLSALGHRAEFAVFASIATLDPYHIRAEVSEEHRAVWTGDEAAKIDDSNPFEWSRHNAQHRTV